MLSLALPGRVFLCTLPTDMRKGFDTLACLVQQELGQDPLAGDLFVFRSRRGDRLKFRPPDIGPSRGERFLPLDSQADTQVAARVTDRLRIHFLT